MFRSRNSDSLTLRRPRGAERSKGGCGPSFEARRKGGERLRMTLWIWLGLVASTSPLIAAEPGRFGYGKPASPTEIAGWDIDARGDDGAGLPAGKGTAARGAEVYAEQCAVC